MNDTPNEHNINFLLNQISDFHITLLIKLMDDIFESLANLFVDKMVKKRMKLHVQIVDQLSKFNLWNKDNKIMELMYNAREKMMNILSCVVFAKLCHIIKYFCQLNQNFGKEYINLSLSSCSRNIRQRKKS